MSLTIRHNWKNAAAVLETMRGHGIIQDRAPVNVDTIAHALGVSVRYDYSLEPRGIIGQILFEDGRPVVRINPWQNAYEPRRRFTLAHELGHFVLHSNDEQTEFIDSQQTMSRTASYWNPIESQANAFAAELLMPQEMIVREGQSVITADKIRTGMTNMPVDAFIRTMAERFVVSNPAMEYRLRGLGVLASST